jgi:hypothetical protein
MVRIAITQAAFDAIRATMPVGSVGYENAVDEQAGATSGLRRTWVDPAEGPASGRRGLTARSSCGWRRPPWRLKQKDRLAAVPQM